MACLEIRIRQLKDDERLWKTYRLYSHEVAGVVVCISFNFATCWLLLASKVEYCVAFAFLF